MLRSDVYFVTDIAEKLCISRTSAYKLINNDPPFPIIRIGRAIRIPKEAFEAWLTQL